MVPFFQNLNNFFINCKSQLLSPLTFPRGQNALMIRILTVFYCALFASFFILGTNAQRNLMYAGMPFLGYFLYIHRQFFQNRRLISLSLIGLCVYFLINYISILWSHPGDGEKLLQRLKMLVFFPLYLAPFLVLCYLSKDFWIRCVTSYVIAAVITGAAIITANLENLYHLERLSGWGRAGNPVQCGLLYGIAFLIILFGHSKLSGFKHWPGWVWILAALVPLTDMILTKSRGPLLACIVVLGAVLVLRCRRYSEFFTRRTLLIIFLGALICGGFLALNYDYIKDRGTTGRGEIWARAVDLTKDSPIFGHGIATKIMYPYHLNGQPAVEGHPHSVYLSALVHTGLVGLFFQLIALFSGLLIGMDYMRRHGDPSAFIFLSSGAVIGLVDYGGYYTNLSTTWIIFWFPMVFLCAVAARGDRAVGGGATKDSRRATGETAPSNP